VGNFTKQTTSAKFIKHAVDFLNELVERDSAAVGELVDTEDDSEKVSVVGVLNTILQRAGSREYIGHRQDESGRVVGFECVSAEWVERSGHRG
jgi:hypothetical protein